MVTPGERNKPSSSTSRVSTPFSSPVEWRRTWDTEVDDALKQPPSFWMSRRCMMSIYIPNLWLNLWYREENAHFFTYLKNLNSHEIRKINGGQNQHLEARNQAPFSPKLALSPFKNAVLWATLKVPHNPQLEFSLHREKNNYTDMPLPTQSLHQCFT